jgi:hypothetical protein
MMSFTALIRHTPLRVYTGYDNQTGGYGGSQTFDIDGNPRGVDNSWSPGNANNHIVIPGMPPSYPSMVPGVSNPTSVTTTAPGGAAAMQPPPDTGGVSDDGSGEWKPKKLPSWAKGLMLGAGIAGLRGGRGANSVPFQMLSSMAQAWKQKQADDEARAKQEEDWKFQQEYRKWWFEQRKAGKLNGNDAGSPPSALGG